MSGNKTAAQKPLKGEAIVSNYGSFDTISANSIVLQSVSIAGLFQDGVFQNVNIIDSNIDNTVIGLNVRNAGYFTSLSTNNDVTFLSLVPGGPSVTWNSETGVFTIGGELAVDGCSFLGNIEICGNDIRATNTNGDIRVWPNGFGTLYLNGPTTVQTTNGNFFVNLPKNSAIFDVYNDFQVTSSSGSVTLSSFDSQELKTVNGDIQLSTESTPSALSVVQVLNTSGNTRVTTQLYHNLKAGDTITLSSTGSIDNVYTVGSVINSNQFLLSVPLQINSTITRGSLLKSLSNKIVLDTRYKVTVPTDTQMTFGPDCNYITGNTSALGIFACNQISLNAPVTVVPSTGKLQLGGASTNYLTFDGTGANINAGIKTTLTGPLTQLDTINTRFRDPIITVGDYTLAASDNKDRGLEFRYFDTVSGQMKLGWFGWKSDTRQFTYIPDATNNGEVISGNPGQFNIGDISATNVSIASGGSLNLNCGSLLNVSQLTSCNGTINIVASNRIGLLSGSDVVLNTNVPVRFGTSGTSITGTSDTLTIVSTSTLVSSGTLVVPVGSALSMDGTTTASIKIIGNTSGDLTLGSSRNIYVTPTTGAVIIPSGTQVQFGTTAQNILGTTSGLTLNSTTDITLASSTGNVRLLAPIGDIQLYTTTGSVRVPQTVFLTFGTTGTMNSLRTTTSGTLVVYGAGSTSGTVQITSAQSINLGASSFVTIPTSTQFLLGTGFVAVTDTSGATQITTGQLQVQSTGIQVTSGTVSVVSSTANIQTNAMNITSATTTVSGSTFQMYTDNMSFRDPILTLGDTYAVDGKDRGIEYRYTLGTVGSKLGWFGWKNSTNKFTFYSDAINTSEVVTGTLGGLDIGALSLSGALIFNTRGAIDIACGTVSNVNTITGCNGQLNVIAANALSVTSASVSIVSSTVSLAASSSVNIPGATPLQFGTTASVVLTTGGVLRVTGGSIELAVDTSVTGSRLDVYSTTVNVQDPIVSIGGVTGPILNDGKDRGIEFKWGTNTQTKTGFFGYKNNISRFVFIRDGTNVDEVFSGAYGDVQFGQGYFTGIDLTGGNLTGVSQIVGGTVSIVSSSGTLNISAGNTVFQNTSKLTFGTTGSIAASGGMVINSSSLTTPATVYIATSGSAITSNTSGLTLTSPNDISLSPSGNTVLPTNHYLAFGSTVNSIISDGQQLFINGYNGVGIVSSTFTISGNVNIIGGITALNTSFDLDNYILPLGKSQKTLITQITNYTTGALRVQTATTSYVKVGDQVTLLNTDSAPDVSGLYTVTSVLDSLTFTVSSPTVLTTPGTKGTVKTNLMLDPGKDVGIGVNYWRNTTGNGVTSGSDYFHNAYFGWRNTTNQWTFYETASIVDNVVTGGTLGTVRVGDLIADRISSFVLTGTVSAGSNIVRGSNFQISGGAIDSTPIGVNSPQSGRFSTLSNTVSASFQNVTFSSSIGYTPERYTLSSASLQTRNPSINSAVSMFSVSGVNYTTSSGTMPTLVTSVPDGTFKTLVCSSMGTGCEHTVYFGIGKLIAPTPLGGTGPSKIVFRRAGQSCQLIFDGVLGAWVILNSGAYIL
ncbi:hypothetical protein EB118_02095 [bacterium]|nr:hypothetical protein [bacterium]NDC93901.1 hypothetical protein [bacterium]NDD83265.1 hypothetical protein [bacterium]NDG28879.1 hypothetical protein [bacterium]